MSVAAAAFVLAPALALGSFLNVVVCTRPGPALASPSAVVVRQLRPRDPLARQHPRALLRSFFGAAAATARADLARSIPLVEAVTAALAVVMCVAVFGLDREAALAIGFCAVLVMLSAIDVAAPDRAEPDRPAGRGRRRSSRIR